MAIPNFIKQKAFFQSRKRGLALLLMLSMLALMMVLIMAFLSNASREKHSAETGAQMVSAQSLADLTVNLLTSQIRRGTSGETGEGGQTSFRGWISQPGMIRTFKQDGTWAEVIKLYSDDTMVAGSASFDDDLSDLPSDWNEVSGRNLYADINAPVETNRDDVAVDPSDPYRHLVFPVVTPSADGEVEGFGITAPPGFQPGRRASASNNPLPMPVKWLYILEDGTVAIAAKSGDDVMVAGASKSNPIVGRVAFWADDDSAKLNVNTASEGVFWDVPRTYSFEDCGSFVGGFSSTPTIDHPGYAVSQPAQKEFQRYPGHPATTSLSPVFGNLWPIPEELTNINKSEASAFYPYYQLVPRTFNGGSEAGTKVSYNELQVRSDRLFTSVDELMFSATRLPGSLTAGDIALRDFFLTSVSSAPEMTPFHSPRISIWPVWYDADEAPPYDNPRTAFDNLTVRCATIGKQPYYLARKNPRSMTDDFQGISRNPVLFRYLQAMTGNPFPGYGSASFKTKYTDAERDQILTYMLDYIRCTNTQDRTTGAKPYTSPYNTLFPTKGAGEVFPLRIPNSMTVIPSGVQGFGRFASVSEACFNFASVSREVTGLDANGAKIYGNTDKMRVLFFMEFSSPLQGMGCKSTNLKYLVEGLDKCVITDGVDQRSCQLPATGVNYIDRPDLPTYHGRGVGGIEGPNHALADKLTFTTGGTTARNYPFYSSVDIPITSPTFKFSTANQLITVKIFPAEADVATAVPLQTLQLRFPDGEFRRPDFVLINNNPDYMDFSKRDFVGTFPLIQGADTVVGLQIAGANPFIYRAPSAGNPLQVDATAGDNRMVNSLISVTSDRFRPHDYYLQTGVRKAHSVLSTTGHPFSGEGAYLGRLVPVSDYNNPGIGRWPGVPPCVGTQVTRVDGGFGDWDTGFGDQKDGAHINKPDEGDTALWDNQGVNRIPYMLGYNQGFAAARHEYFSPNRQIPSSMMFGSLPTGVQRLRPWQTLLFHPRPEDPGHPGRQDPPDHLLAELFWMPVIEPYAISQPFATGGKVNINYQIQPFTYIQRDTAMRGVMKSTKFLALPLEDAKVYKPIDPSGRAVARAPNRRQRIDADVTLKQFTDRFETGDFFQTASEICEVHLLPPGQTVDGMANFWINNKLTGDNLRERPYADIYPRLTVKSNAFTMHYRVQVLKKARSTDGDKWVDGSDQIVAEQRGSAVVERYIDTEDSTMPDFASMMTTSPNAPEMNLERYVKVRVLNTRRFAP